MPNKNTIGTYIVYLVAIITNYASSQHWLDKKKPTTYCVIA